jgi:hypothetical protein
VTSLVTASINGLELSRVLANALAFVPARAKTPFIRLSVGWGYVSATGTDTYAVGHDVAACPTSGSVSVTLNRADAVDLEAAARKDKKGLGTLTVERQGVLYLPSQASVEGSGVAQVSEDHSELWDACDRLLDRLEGSRLALPTVVAFQPDILARFAKVKAVGENVADFYFYDQHAQVLVRFGETFRGAIMPITREQAPEGSLWNE